MSYGIAFYDNDGAAMSPFDDTKNILTQIASGVQKLAGPGGANAAPGTAKIKITGLKGEAGSVVITGTTKVDGDFESIQVLADAVLAAYVAPAVQGDSLVGVTIPAGSIIYGHFSSITLTSGKVIAYRTN